MAMVFSFCFLSRRRPVVLRTLRTKGIKTEGRAFNPKDGLRSRGNRPITANVMAKQLAHDLGTRAFRSKWPSHFAPPLYPE
ncbi:hypothetical protein AGR1A_Cc50480 [Agrobacterium fabacearum CFBP 5771]|nr:hypothetical protein AGR1A_Cc50480 [Agrobacterium fabacearum CFBP 5771]